MTKHIIKETPPEWMNLQQHFDDDGLTEAGGEFCYNLFIVPLSKNHNGFNMETYAEILSEIEFHNNFAPAYACNVVAKYLTSKTEKRWAVTTATGYCQGDVVKIIYCKHHYNEENARAYGEIWLGAAKEFDLFDLNEDGEETHNCGGYIVADCQARTDSEYKKLLCQYACIKENETRLEMIDGSKTHIIYSYRAS